MSSVARSSQQLDPSAEARERRPELVRRLARHAGPQALARGVAARANDVDAGEQQNERRHDACSTGMMRSPFTTGGSP